VASALKRLDHKAEGEEGQNENWVSEGKAGTFSCAVFGSNHHSTSATCTSTNLSHPDTALLPPTTTEINPLFDSSAVYRRSNSPCFIPECLLTLLV